MNPETSFKVTYWLGSQRVQFCPANWQPATLDAGLLPPGSLQPAAYTCPPDGNGIGARLWTADTHAGLHCWKLEVVNHGSQPVEMERIDMLDREFPNSANADWGFYANGWQSWSPAVVYSARERMLTSRLGILQRPMIENPGTPVYTRPGQFSSDFYGILVERRARSAVLCGFLSQAQHFGTCAADLRAAPRLRLWANGDRARLNPNASIQTDWAVLWNIADIDQPDPCAAYLDACAAWNEVRLPQNIPVGWCSWYHYYQNVTEADIRSNLQAMAALRTRLPVDLLQIDDGFEAQVGDWLLPHARFPRGVAGLADEIKAAGMQPGLWLAPFIVHPTSKLAKEHPHWLLCRADGRPTRAGWTWGALGMALDLTHPQALDYTRQVIHTAVHEWGYPYLKLDFLYAAALPCRYQDPTRTRAQVLRQGMQTIRQAAGPDTFILGCGLPLGSALGLVQGMRIGADVSGDYYPNIYGVKLGLKEEPAVPCLRNAVRNTLNRAALHGRWWLNDPDCLLTRPDTKLTVDEVRSWATLIYMSGGMLLISDDMARLPAERLTIFEKLLPLQGARPRVLDGLDRGMPERLRADLPEERHLLAAFNWEDMPRTVRLTPASFHLRAEQYSLRNAWTDEALPDFTAAGMSFDLPAHGCIWLEAR